ILPSCVNVACGFSEIIVANRAAITRRIARSRRSLVARRTAYEPGVSAPSEMPASDLALRLLRRTGSKTLSEKFVNCGRRMRS
ncbi:UNVERIFIED_CONTAM: hypothetical protein GTU68_037801, partial [Idotea baltica]|nr:hypothetical protein [Idotea baltica]